MSGLTPQESFRMGFLLRCAEEGCDVNEIQDRVKFANSKSWGDVIKSIAMLPVHASALGLGGALLAGPAAGYGLAKLQESSVSPEEINQQELINTYKLQAALAKQRAKQREYRQSAPASPQLFESGE